MIMNLIIGLTAIALLIIWTFSGNDDDNDDNGPDVMYWA